MDGFADPSRAPAAGTYQADFVTYSGDRLLAAVLDEVIYLVDTTGEVPIEVNVDEITATVKSMTAGKRRMTRLPPVFGEGIGCRPCAVMGSGSGNDPLAL